MFAMTQIDAIDSRNIDITAEFKTDQQRKRYTLLNRIMGMMELAIASSLTEIQRSHLNAANCSAQHLHRLANDIPDHLIGDPARLRQVLTNLISIVISFIDRLSVTLKVYTATVMVALPPLSIVVAEDDTLSLRFVSEPPQGDGHQITTVVDGSKAKQELHAIEERCGYRLTFVLALYAKAMN